MSSSWRTTVTGLINIGIGIAVLVFAILFIQGTEDLIVSIRATIAMVGVGLITAGATGLTARDQRAHEADRPVMKAQIKAEVSQAAVEEAKDVARQEAKQTVRETLKHP